MMSTSGSVEEELFVIVLRKHRTATRTINYHTIMQDAHVRELCMNRIKHARANSERENQ